MKFVFRTALNITIAMPWNAKLCSLADRYAQSMKPAVAIVRVELM